jgi:hypothetical protein
MPSGAREVLLTHGPAITAALEYFGETYTSNHLANDGRGLFELGLALGDGTSAELGGRVLREEAKRIFLPSGVLREGSTHYHALLARNYAAIAATARKHGHPIAGALTEIAERAASVVPVLTLPGGMPLIGDISPDVAPASVSVPASNHTADRACLLRDGWARIDAQRWSMLSYASPIGLPPLPGHGHQDMTSFELHHGTQVVIRDPGRGTYMNAEDVAAAAQNGISIDGADPYPTNRAHYDDAFRREISGPPPQLHLGADELRLTYRHGVRRWRFTAQAVIVDDEIAGSGTHRIVRRLHTTLPVSGDIIGGRYRVRTETPLRRREARCWTAYGESEPASCIEIETRVSLPARLSFTIELV